MQQKFFKSYWEFSVQNSRKRGKKSTKRDEEWVDNFLTCFPVDSIKRRCRLHYYVTHQALQMNRELKFIQIPMESYIPKQKGAPMYFGDAYKNFAKGVSWSLNLFHLLLTSEGCKFNMCSGIKSCLVNIPTTGGLCTNL